MTRKICWVLVAIGVAGCVQQTAAVDPQQAAEAAADPPALDAVLAQLEPNEGEPLGGGLVLRDARGEAGRLVLDMQLSDAGPIATPTERAGFIAGFEGDFGTQLCAVPTLRSFIETRGGVTATVAAPDGSPLAARSIESC